jgi:hypothetical protein
MKYLTIAAALLLAVAATQADWFNLPADRGSTTAPSSGGGRSRSTLVRVRDFDAALSDHAVYFARADLGISDKRLAATAAQLAQGPGIAALPPDQAFLVGHRYSARVQIEMQRVTGPARLAAAKALGAAAEYKCRLPLRASAAGQPADAEARLEQAIVAANLAIRAQGVRLEFSRWLEEAIAANSH